MAFSESSSCCIFTKHSDCTNGSWLNISVMYSRILCFSIALGNWYHNNLLINTYDQFVCSFVSGLEIYQTLRAFVTHLGYKSSQPRSYLSVDVLLAVTMMVDTIGQLM